MRGSLSGRQVLITAGPTREPIDPVRFISNRSSGKMAFGVAAAARQEGARVQVVSGPVELTTPEGVDRIDVETAQEMYEIVLANVGTADIFIGAAAVSDYRPDRAAAQKIKKNADELVLRLVRTSDILGSVAALRPRPFVVGFAAETHDLEHYARTKLEEKQLDMIAANRVGKGIGFETDSNALTVLWPGGRAVLPEAEKTELARGLVALIVERFQRREEQ